MELMFYSFAYVALDQMINNAACVRYMSGGLINCPIVIRGPANGGTNVGATHSHTTENIFANVPGLKVVTPSTALDAYGLMNARGMKLSTKRLRRMSYLDVHQNNNTLYELYNEYKKVVNSEAANNQLMVLDIVVGLITAVMLFIFT